MKQRSAYWSSLVIVLAASMIISSGYGLAGEYQWPKRYIIGTSSMGSTGYAMNVAFSTAVEETTGMKVRIMPEDNISVRTRQLKHGEMDSIGGECGMAAEVIMAVGGYATEKGGPFPLRDMYPTANNVLAGGFFVRGDSDIKTIWDVKPGIRIANFTAVPAMMKSYRALLAWAGVEEKDAVFVPFGGYAASMRAISQKKADIAYGLPVAPVILELESSPGGIRWIDMNPNASERDKEGAKRFRKHMPTWSFTQNRMGVESAKGFWGLTSSAGNFVSKDADADFIYNLTKWIAENYDLIKTKHRMLAAKSPQAFKAAMKTFFIPLHDGTIRYAKEIDAWTPAEDLRQKYNVWLVDQYTNAYTKALQQAKMKNISIAYNDENWIQIWEDAKKDLPIFAVMTDEEISEAAQKFGL